ncbi:MAG: hypothetical protein DMG78_23210 [Acidobacteria bacterium]|nr:MAG: hypothetical protein DMG78_23210 [Acidobacteriota bacterium]
MDNPAEKPPQKAAPKLRTFAQFLETSPPDVAEEVCERVSRATPIRLGGEAAYLSTPDLQLHCEQCGGVRTFECSDDSIYLVEALNYKYLRYECRNCRKTEKKFAVVIKGASGTGPVQKLGELPPFGPPTPPRVFKLIGEEYRELFLQGRRAENKGLGIGAYAYYRRIVEHQKGQIIEEIGKVAKKLGATPEVMKTFTDARSETQFATAIEKIKKGIPESLLIDGHNPLTLLHTALSEGLHELTDQECLTLATSIRVVLTELADRISTALKEAATLKSAVGRLLNRKLT